MKSDLFCSLPRVENEVDEEETRPYSLLSIRSSIVNPLLAFQQQQIGPIRDESRDFRSNSTDYFLSFICCCF
jgi:hypothetical protein